MTGRQSYRSRLILFADYFFGPPTFVYQKFNYLLPRIFQILDKVDSVIQVHGTSSQPWHKEIFAWMHTSRLIGFLLECEFNHVKREKCEKIDKRLKTLLVLESFLFALFQRTWRKKKTRELKLKFVFVLAVSHHDRSNHDRRIMSENPRSNEISSNKGSRSIEVYFPILFYKYFGTLITGRFMEDGRLIGGHLMEAQLYTEWDDNHVCIINQWKGWEEILHDGMRKSPPRTERSYNTALLNRDMLWQKFPRDKWRNAVLR